MPCRDDGAYDNIRTEYREDPLVIARLNRVTRLLCYVLSRLPIATYHHLVSLKKKEARELREWWEDHQRSDAEREKRENAKRLLEKKKRAALSKLSPEDKSILGLK